MKGSKNKTMRESKTRSRLRRLALLLAMILAFTNADFATALAADYDPQFTDETDEWDGIEVLEDESMLFDDPVTDEEADELEDIYIDEDMDDAPGDDSLELQSSPDEAVLLSEDSAFNQSVEIDGILITVTADEGVFPSDAALNVKRILDEKELLKLQEAVEEAEEKEEVSESDPDGTGEIPEQICEETPEEDVKPSNREKQKMTLCNTICEVIGDSEITRSTDSVEALNIAKDINPDIVFLDIDMPGMDGMKLAKEIKESVNPKVNIIFTTGYSEYLEEAFTKLRASGYLMKPVTEKMLRNEIENLRYPPHLEILGSKAVRVRAFGTFEVYVNGTPVNFHYVKTKELLAYLIDRDGMCSISELEEGIFEEAEDRADHNLIVPLRENPFRQVGDESLSIFAFCISQTSCIFSCVLQSAALQCTF